MCACEWTIFSMVWREKRYETGWSAVSLFISYLCRTVSLNDTSEWKHTRYIHPRWRNIAVTIWIWYKLFLDGARESFCPCMCVLQQVPSMSGLNINVDKTKAVWIWSRKNWKLRFIPEINLDWIPVTFTVLGVVFSTYVLEIVTINFENKLNEMNEVLNAWTRRNLTPFGRITVMKSLAISKITHLLMNLPDPEESFFVGIE